jgi:hypothetical protein
MAFFSKKMEEKSLLGHFFIVPSMLDLNYDKSKIQRSYVSN